MLAEEGEAATGAPGGRKKLLIPMIAGLVVLLAAGGGAAAFALGVFGEAESEHVAEESHASAGGHGAPEIVAPLVYFVELPDILVNLRSGSGRPRYLKLRVALEVDDESLGQQVAALTPRMMDSFQLYLRALEASELDGSLGMQRLKEELLARVNLAIAPRRVNDVLIKELLVQ